MAWHLYILRCGDGSLYTGISTDPCQRLRRHNAGKGSRYVRRKGMAALVYTEPCVDKRAARRRELEIQSWSRQEKLLLLTSVHGHAVSRL
jgi:predicted GIY-YIG superfamily endonuclease